MALLNNYSTIDKQLSRMRYLNFIIYEKLGFFVPGTGSFGEGDL